jgi:SAM-dependent methyltransferase
VGKTLKDSLFQDYSRKHVQFYDVGHPVLVEYGINLVKEIFRKPAILDLGCGDGRLLFSCYEQGLFNNIKEIVGVDISEKRVKRMTKELPFVKGVVADALNVEIYPSMYFDYIICSQLIEHVENDAVLVDEIKRLLKKGGLVYISSVVKKWYGVYYYFIDGSFRLDPTHVREYGSIDEFTDLITNEGFKLVDLSSSQVKYSLLDLVIRLFIKLGFIQPDVRFYEKHKLLAKIRDIKVPIIGYKTIEVLVRKIE